MLQKLLEPGGKIIGVVQLSSRIKHEIRLHGYITIANRPEVRAYLGETRFDPAATVPTFVLNGARDRDFEECPITLYGSLEELELCEDIVFSPSLALIRQTINSILAEQGKTK